MTDRARAIREYIEKDAFTRHLGGKLELLEPGHCRVSITVTEDMVNFHGTTHGGAIFTLGDLALAGASNSRGQTAFALNLSINFLERTGPGDRLVADAREIQESGPTAGYELVVDRRTADGEQPIARAQAISYRKKEWFVAP